jgi:hypothetical protein
MADIGKTPVKKLLSAPDRREFSCPETVHLTLSLWPFIIYVATAPHKFKKPQSQNEALKLPKDTS